MKNKHNIENVIEIGTKLFWEKGYFSLGTQEIIDKTGMTRGAFYNRFKSKEEFLIACINDYARLQIDEIKEALVDENKSDLNKIRSYYTTSIISMPTKKYRGCLINNITAEMGDVPDTLAEVINNYNNAVIQITTKCIRHAQDSQEIHPNLNSNEIAQLLYYSYLGVITEAKSRKSYENGLGIFRSLFQMISK